MMNNRNINRLVLANGITLLIVENEAADLIAGKIFLKNIGGRWESKDKVGISHLLASVITKGTENFSSQEIAERVESIGASFGADAASDYFVVSLKTVSADFPTMLKLAAEIMRSPTFPEAEVELEKNLTLQSIRSQQEQPFNVAFNQLREAMYRDHPYGFSILGTEETVAQLNRSDLQQYHQTLFRPDRLVISLSGRISLDNAVSLVEEIFGDWQGSSSPIIPPQLPRITPKSCQKISLQETQQSIVTIGYFAAAVKDDDYTTLKLLNTYLGNGLSSRLFVELREKRGLAYDVSAFYPTRLDDSQFVVYIGTAPVNTAIALEGLRAEIDRLCKLELTLEELQAAKNKLLGQYALGKQTNAEIAQVYGWYEALGLGINFDSEFQEDITKVTTQMAREVACRYFTQPYISIVGPEAEIKNQLGSF